MQVKICGITQVDQALAIAHLGATDLGFICVAQSPRYVAPVAIAALLKALAADGWMGGTVGVFANAEAETILEVVHQTGLNTVQLHGAESLEFCQALRQALPQHRIIKAIRVRTPADLDQALAYADPVDALLLDAYHPDQLGGTGLTLDWQALGTFVAPCPWFLAGGLRPDNIQQALRSLHPYGIDLSSGVETCPGVKNLALVKQLFDQLHRLGMADSRATPA
ncbi:N-(5'-phosphoribosyl)anthranilate isomerase [Leptolyngbya sp. BL0902]|uniref:phosphoribosylanthranilate isomerase n=1 Tax=Leptolyngbya sp. BL0902 TaxID=1115757 RepID=UPI0018E75B67|nr:phosphoribosylanthranilate isomerase [Leptolyngbya sp. BL0902]QQE64267.1 N-(5'-phosphoribosyl)anthranilate isomerase [Leptolyngbya sp. BL0902]